MASRIPLAMSRDRLLPPAFARVNAGGTPALGLLASTAAAVLFILWGRLQQVLAVMAFFFVANYVMAFLAVFVLRRREPDAPRPFRRLGLPVSPPGWRCWCRCCSWRAPSPATPATACGRCWCWPPAIPCIVWCGVSAARWNRDRWTRSWRTTTTGAPLAEASTIPAAGTPTRASPSASAARCSRRSWQLAARADQLAAPGQYVTTEIAGEPIVRGARRRRRAARASSTSAATTPPR